MEALGPRSGSEVRIYDFGAKVGGTVVKIGGFRAKIEASGFKIGPGKLGLWALGPRL